MEDAEGALAGGTPHRLLHVGVHPTLTTHLVIPHLSDFLTQYPAVELRFSEGDRYVDLVREGGDCAIRVGTASGRRWSTFRLRSSWNTRAGGVQRARHMTLETIAALGDYAAVSLPAMAD